MARAHVLFSIALATCEVKQDITCYVPCSTDDAFKVMENVVEHMGIELEAATRIIPVRSH
jgi:hypothetical protein